MTYYELDLKDKERIEAYRKKWKILRFISRFFCMHYWKRNGMYGSDDIWTCCRCGKDYYQNVTFDTPPISHVDCLDKDRFKNIK